MMTTLAAAGGAASEGAGDEEASGMLFQATTIVLFMNRARVPRPSGDAYYERVPEGPGTPSPSVSWSQCASQLTLALSLNLRSFVSGGARVLASRSFIGLYKV